jgi:hypothetical protein
MINNIKSIFLFVTILSIFFSSCDDYLTKEISYEELGFEKLMVINTKITDQGDSTYISISKNINYKDQSTAKFELINDAEVKFSINNVDFPVSKYAGLKALNYNFFVKRNNETNSGMDFKISAKHPDYPDVESSIRLAPASTYVTSSFEENALTKVFFGVPLEFHKVKITLADDTEEDRYYRFRLEGQSIDFISSDDPNASSPSEYSDELLFVKKASGVKNYVYEILFTSYDNIVDPTQLSVVYENITRSQYLFAKSIGLYWKSQDFGIFSEPTTLYSNIDGGLGLFSAEDRFVFQVE